MKPRKRCRCRDADGRDLGTACPKLKRRDGSWNPTHGTWYGKTELPPGPNGQRVTLKAGGFATEDELKDWFRAAELLLSIPERGPRGHEDRMQILDLIKDARKRGEDLPDYDDVRTRHKQGVAYRTGLLGDYLDAWIAGKKKIRKNTTRGYESHIRIHLKPRLGKIELDKLRVSDIEGMFAKIETRNERIRNGEEKGRETGPATQKLVLATLANALESAVARGLLTFNPARHVELAPAKRAKPLVWTPARVEAWRAEFDRTIEEMRTDRPGRNVDAYKVWRNPSLRPSRVMVWSPQQTGEFLDRAAGHRLYALFHLIVYTGMRRGEACGLAVADVDLDAGELRVRSNLVQLGWEVEEDDPKTEASDAPVALDKETVKVLHAHLKQQKKDRLEWGEAWVDSGKMFVKENGEALHPAFVTDQFERLAFEADLPPITLHGLRHGAATMGLAAGLDMKVVSARLRHSSTTITADLYSSVLPDLAREAAEKTAAMVPRKASGRRASVTGRSPNGSPRLVATQRKEVG